MEDKGKCMHLCDSPEIHENDKMCSGSPPSQCRTQLSCGTKGCACWLKLQCNGGTGGNPSADGKVSVHTYTAYMRQEKSFRKKVRCLFGHCLDSICEYSLSFTNTVSEDPKNSSDAVTTDKVPCLVLPVWGWGVVVVQTLYRRWGRGSKAIQTM